MEKSGDRFLHNIFQHMEPHFVSTVLMYFSKEARERMHRNIPEEIGEQVRELLEYPTGSVGRIMTTDYLSFNKNMISRDAISKIRDLSKKRMPASYAYVIDDENHLAGVLNMRDLMIAPGHQPLEAIMLKDVFTLHCFVDIKDAASELAKRKYFAAPVVDSENHILGIIKAERLIQGVQEETSQDILRMFGVGGEERVFSSVFFSLKKRLFWLNVNLITAFLAAAVCGNI